MPANRYDLEIEQGATFRLILNVQDANTMLINLNSYSATMQLRTDYANASVTESLSTSNGEIIEGNVVGQYVFTLVPTRTANVYVDLKHGGFPPKKNYVYDVSLTDGQGIVSKIIWGNVTVYGQVTR